MPLVRFKIRNELSLGGPELNRSAAVENEEPKAILGAVEVAGLIGILRQLGDLAEFSAEVFNGIQEEVTVTASRCQKLTGRVRRIESALSPLEKAVLSQTSHIHFAYTAGSEWHPRIRNGHSHFVQSDLPLCVMESYEQCRDPPPLHLLDRFSIGGPGSCLRKYSDPTFFRKKLGNPNKADDIKVQRDQAHRKRKKKRLPQRNICRSNAVSTSDETNGPHLSSLTDDRQTTSQSTSTVDMPRSSNMQELSDIMDQSHLQGQLDVQEQSEAQVQSDFQESSKARDSITGSGYIEYVINQSPVNKPEVKLVEGYLSGSLQPADRIGSAVPEGCTGVVDDNILYSPSEDLHGPCVSVSREKKKEKLEPMEKKSSKVEEVSEMHESKFGPETPDRGRQNQKDFDRTHILFDEVDIVQENESKNQANNIDGTLVLESEGEDKSEQGSEVDEFVDARNTIDSESESDLDGVPKPKLEHYFGDVSTYCSEDANSDNNDGSEDTPYEQMAHAPRHENPLDESCSGSCLPNDANGSFCLSDPVCGKILSYDETFQKPWEFFAECPSLLAEEAFPNIAVLREEPVAAHPILAGDSTQENISSEYPTSSCLSLKDAIPTEKILPEEHLANHPSLAEAIPHEKTAPGESVAKFPSFAERMELSSEDWPRAVRDVPEILPQEKILPRKSLPSTLSVAESVYDNMTPSGEPDTARPSFSEAIQENNSKNLSVPEADSQEKISLEEAVGIYPCLVKSVPDERLLTEEIEEPATTCQSLTKAMPIEKNFPEQLLEEHHYLLELPKEKILQETFVGSTHPSCAKAGPDANLSSEVLTSTYLSVAEAIPQEQMPLEEFVGVNPYLAEANPDERFSPEEPVTTHLSLTKSVVIEKVLAEELLETYPGELPKENILHEETDDATDPSEAVSDEEILSEVSNSTNVSLEESLPEEQLSVEEFVGINPFLAKAIPDETFLPEENVPTCLSLTKAAAIEGVLPEKSLETYPSLVELSKAKMSHEETNDVTRLSEAIYDEEISSEVSESTNLSLEEALPQEKISLEEVGGINPCLAEAIPDERLLPEEPGIPYLSLTNDAAIKGILPEKPLETYLALAELPEEKVLHEEADDATHPSLFEAVSNEQILPELLDSTNLLVAEAELQEQIPVEEYVGIDPCFTEAIPDKRPEGPVITCMSIEEGLPEEPLEAYASLEQLPKYKISQETIDDTKHPSCAKTESDENIAPEVLDLTNLSVAEAIPHMQISLEESSGIVPFSAVDVPDERISPEEPITTCLPLAKAMPIETIIPEKSSEIYPSSEESYEEKILQDEEPDDATHPSFSETVGDKKNSPLEMHGSTYPSLEESVHLEKTSHEELLSTNSFLAVAVPDERILPEEPVTTCVPLTKATPVETIFPEESLEVYPSLVESQEEKIWQEEELDDATHPSFSEAVGDEKISSLEVPDSTYPSLEESVPHEKISQEELGSTNPFLELAVPKERSFPDKPGVTYQSLAEAASKENNLPEKPLPAYSSLAEAVPDEKISLEEPDAEAVFDENISGFEAPGSMIVTGPHNKVFPDDFAVDNSLAEAGFHEKIPDSEAPVSITETGPHDKTFPKEHFPDDDILPKEPAATYLALAEGIPDQKVFLDDAALLLFAEAIFDQKFSPEVPDSTYPSLKEPEMHAAPPSLVTDLPAKNISVKEGAAYGEPYSASDVSMNQKSGFLESESADRTIPFSGSTFMISLDTRESLSNGTNVEPVSIWSNGGLLGLAPLKPPVFAEPNSASEHLQNEINKASVLSTRKQESSSLSIENTEKSSLPIVVSDPTSQQHSNMLSPSHLQSTGTSFRVFGLSHRLFMAGFRGNSSSTCKFESVPSSSYDTNVAATRDKSQQTLGDSSFEEQLDYESSLFGSPTSSPLVEHMKISFNPKDASPVPKLKLRIPSQTQYNGQNADMFPSFQLVPEASNSDDDDNSDTFCQSSPCVSDNCLSDSELWESDESPRKTVSSLEQVGERNRHGDMGSFSGSFLDLPCYDAVDHQSTSSRLDQEQVPEYKPSVSEIIRDWPPNQPKSSPSIEANDDANTVLKKTQDQSPGENKQYIIT
ncbi:hypothetical protein CARUB_v10003966mg [Capsella rubella]|uniref:WH2 domain-containing protein n=1 Tax=Capsella rubella TaxID=81985 RepID=R0GFB2_9BRAS|nr:scar-like domain-containing protein WAVE 5 isoform X2 [Capsella rubella]EOA15429.1 hypothetical protein CARUB_v10003966mg [Capsella rubella]